MGHRKQWKQRNGHKGISATWDWGHLMLGIGFSWEDYYAGVYLGPFAVELMW